MWGESNDDRWFPSQSASSGKAWETFMVLYVSCRHFSFKGSLPKTRMYLSYDKLLSCWIFYHTEYVFIYRIIKIISSASNFRSLYCHASPNCCSSCCTHWGRVTHISVGILTIIGSENGLSHGRRQVIIWTNARILLIEPFGTNFSEILFEIHIFTFMKMHLKISSGKWRPFCLDLDVLRWTYAFGRLMLPMPY